MAGYSVILNKLYRGASMALWVIGRNLEGGQVVVLKGNEVLLIKTRYRACWEFPGGSAKKGETPEEAAIREAREEGAIHVRSLGKKLGTYGYKRWRLSITNHLYLVTDWEEREQWRPSFEIIERGFFPLSGLPVGLSPSTKLRFKEFFPEGNIPA